MYINTQHDDIQHNSKKNAALSIQNSNTQHNDPDHNGIQFLCRVSFMLSFANKSIMLSAIMLIVFILNVVAPNL